MDLVNLLIKFDQFNDFIDIIIDDYENIIFKKDSLYNLLYNISIGFLLFLFFYKLHFQSFIPISGDELNSILVYSTNIKTVFLKNFPGNVTFFHFLGFLKTIFLMFIFQLKYPHF